MNLKDKIAWIVADALPNQEFTEEELPGAYQKAQEILLAIADSLPKEQIAKVNPREYGTDKATKEIARAMGYNACLSEIKALLK